MSTSVQAFTYPLNTIQLPDTKENNKFMKIIYQVIEFRNQNRGSNTLDERSELLLCVLLNETNWWVEDRHYIYVCMEKISFDKYLFQEDSEFFMTVLENMAEDAMMNEDADACTEDTY
jgi:hypothetical protein